MNEKVVENILSTIDPRSDWYPWAKNEGLYISQDVLLKRFQEESVLVVDTRDEDFIGGNIRNATHLADEKFDSTSIEKILNSGANLVVFHCMESIRRGNSQKTNIFKNDQIHFKIK